MMNLWFSIMVLFSISAPIKTLTQNKGDDVLGDWVNEKKDSKFRIYKQGNKYFGKILWGEGKEEKDVKNPNPALRSRELVGLVLLNDFVFDGDDTWESGTIYDPREGKTYSCKMWMESYNILKVKGYVGISLFGRSETWARIK